MKSLNEKLAEVHSYLIAQGQLHFERGSVRGENSSAAGYATAVLEAMLIVNGLDPTRKWRFPPGTPVRKIKGHEFVGIYMAEYGTLEVKCVVRCTAVGARGLEFIFRPEQLEQIPEINAPFAQDVGVHPAVVEPLNWPVGEGYPYKVES